MGADRSMIFLAALTAAGMCACEYLLRRRRPALALALAAGHSRN